MQAASSARLPKAVAFLKFMPNPVITPLPQPSETQYLAYPVWLASE